VGAETSQAPSWSPDGRTLAYADGGIKLIGADGRRARAITPTKPGRVDQWPRWSPSGRSVLFARQLVDGMEPATLLSVDVATRRADTLASTYLTSPTYSWAPR
jgi:Tol biopolymer transport system component